VCFFFISALDDPAPVGRAPFGRVSIIQWLLEYIPEDCEFEADEEEICQLECMKKKMQQS